MVRIHSLACVFAYVVTREVHSSSEPIRSNLGRESQKLLSRCQLRRRSLAKVDDKDMLNPLNPLRALAWFLAVLDPICTFSCFVPQPRLLIGNPRIVRSCPCGLVRSWKRLDCNVPSMQYSGDLFDDDEFFDINYADEDGNLYTTEYSYEDLDPTIPNEYMLTGNFVPEKNVTLRSLEVVKVTEQAVFLEVDSLTGLQGVIYSAGLDVHRIKNIEATFFVGDVLDVKSLGVSPTSGKLLLSRRLIIEEEGEERHCLPDDGRELPAPRKPPRVQDISIPPPGAKVPEKGTILRGLKVVRVQSKGIFVEVDAEQNLIGFIPKAGLDVAYLRNVEASFREGDRIDAKLVCVSFATGKLLLSRLLVMKEEGAERHHLPDDGREPPVRMIPPLVYAKSKEPEEIDISIPPVSAKLPALGSTLRGLKIVKMEDLGVFVEVDADQNLGGWIPKAGLDTRFLRHPEDGFKVGDVIDAKVVGTSLVSGRFLLSRKAVLEDEAWEKFGRPNPQSESQLVDDETPAEGSGLQ